MKKGLYMMFEKGNDSGTTSYWLSSIDQKEYPTLSDNLEIDIGIVGGGITGITTAYLLSKQGYKVCLIDAKRLFSGTTGNTTAKITAQHGLFYDDLINNFGIEKAALYYQSNLEAKRFIEKTIENYHIDCNYTTEDSYVYTDETKQIKKIENEWIAYEKLNIDGQLTEQLNTPFPAKYAIVMKNQAHFHPLSYLQTLVDQCKENNVLIFENTRAVHVDYGKQPAIVCSDGIRILCRYVIQASHYPFFDGSRFFPIKMYADRSYVIQAKTKKTIKNGMYINVENPKRSYRSIEVDGETFVLIAGENHKTGQSTVTMKKHYDSLISFTDKYFNIERLTSQWSAQDYTTLDKIPYVGKMTTKQDQVFVATGFNKWGMTNGTNAAILIADLILEKESPYESLYSPSRETLINPALKNIVSYNADVAKHLIKGKLDLTGENLEELTQNEACIIMKNGERIGVYKDDKGNIHAVDTTCTHVGCELEWNSAENSWDCPCHGSRFTIDGEIINGPAEKALRKIEIKN